MKFDGASSLGYAAYWCTMCNALTSNTVSIAYIKTDSAFRMCIRCQYNVRIAYCIGFYTCNEDATHNE